MQYVHSFPSDRNQAFEVLHSLYVRESQVILNDLKIRLEELDFATRLMAEALTESVSGEVAVLESQQGLVES
jgi:hypothetical protein